MVRVSICWCVADVALVEHQSTSASRARYAHDLTEINVKRASTEEAISKGKRELEMGL